MKRTRPEAENNVSPTTIGDAHLAITTGTSTSSVSSSSSSSQSSNTNNSSLATPASAPPSPSMSSPDPSSIAAKRGRLEGDGHSRQASANEFETKLVNLFFVRFTDC
jgi:hypothetical protein